ncbi:MAG: hypothetical protein OK474_02560 [Thaumarchaeota archaeon]|nr:hypothetical protein [Nitrososphaerota archaeon]
MPFWPELEEVEDCSLVVLETIELSVDEVEETPVLADDVDEKVIEEVVLLSVRVTVELVVDDEAIDDAREDVTELEPELDEALEIEGAEPGDCRLMAAPSATSVSATATAKIVLR